jgi:ribosomal protein S27AE
MVDASKTCPKCNASMMRGHMPDITHGGVVQERWTPGDPEELRFLGMKAGIKSKPKESLPIVAYRCVKCGFLELYATG